MRSKKMAYVSLVGCMLFTMLLSACGGGNEGAETKSEEPEQIIEGPVEPMGAFEPAISIDAIRYVGEEVKFPEGQDIKNNVWTDLYTELGMNLNYKWIVTGKEQYDSKVNIAIASNDLPDILEVNATQLRQLADAGQLADLTAAFENYASDDLKKVMNIDPNALPSATFDGKLLAMPSTQPVIGGSAPLLWVRADWMEKLNLDPPSTIEDVIKIAEAFATQDPDGNGVDDTYGFALNKDVGTSGFSIGFMNGYGAYPQIWVDKGDGELVYGSIQPEMKTALASLQEMYKNKLIDPEFGVKDTIKVFETITSNKIGLLSGPSWYPAWPFWDMVKEDSSIDWVSYPIPSQEGGNASVQMPFSVSHYYVVTKGFEHPEAIIKMANLYYEKLYSDNAEFEKYGTVTTDKDSIGVNKYSLVEVVNPNKDLIRQEELETALETKSDEGISSAETKIMYEEFVRYLDGSNPAGWSGYKASGPDGSMKQLRILNDEGKVISNGFVGAPTETMGQRKATLDTMEQEVFTKIIIGESSVDAFDKFVEDWKKLGGDSITQEVNEWKQSK
ncbi:extracellular solute-binding protein [Paenibacillus lemnae]|uniref:Extracellular solute-binding protein n=1 Tax=Paenibacillus lemnae TaxID=1330551 RepID=A0A848MAL3_PAELE|nr:extracellular solute-binding protein [Paenibacillus lemnae]NMO97705.1 extracellular solute-binding protein [Paenibacillus lemnae]